MRSEARAVAPGEDVAIVTWMGYDAPQVHEIVSSVDRNVLNAKLARDNAGALADFVTGVEAARDRPAHQTVWAHSYGGDARGLRVAAHERRRRRRRLRRARPAVLRRVAHRAQARLPQRPRSGRATTSSATAGWCTARRRPRSPGASRLSTFALKQTGTGCNHWLHPRSDFVDVGRTSAGHSDYLRAGTDSARNLVAIAAGRPDLRVFQGADERACTTTGPSLGTDPLTLAEARPVSADARRPDPDPPDLDVG